MMQHLLCHIVCLFFVLSSMMAQSSIILNDSTMFIGQQVDSLTEEQRYFNPLYLIMPKGEEHMKQQLVRGSICDCDPTIPNRRIGIFSVAPDKFVSFSQGNLQYFPAADIWKFADNQYDHLGNANLYTSSTFRNWIDLFGWSADNQTAPFGVSTSLDLADYAGEFIDWGTNEICGDAPNTWRTLSKDEWDYLLNQRPNAKNRVSVAQVNGISGCILLPDIWETPAGIDFKIGLHSKLEYDYSVYQSLSKEQWKILEYAGAVFLPANGRRRGNKLQELYAGAYWTCSEKDGIAYNWYFRTNLIAFYHPKDNDRYGRFVRLVHDTIVPTNHNIFSVAEDRQVAFSPGNLQYVPSTHTWQFAEEQYHYLGKKNLTNTSTLADTIDLFGWSGKDSQIPFGINTSNHNTDYAGDFLDWGTNPIADSKPNTWRTMSYDEWDYILNHRPNAQKLFGMAAINEASGLILLPDNWQCPNGIIFIPGFSATEKLKDYAQHQSFTLEQWRLLEQSGAIFIPAAGGRTAGGVANASFSGGYWCSSWQDESKAHCFHFFSGLIKKSTPNRYHSYSVRLVQDINP